MPQSSAVRHALLFYGITLFLATLVRLAVPWVGVASLPLTMLTPAVAVLLMQAAIAPEGGWRSFAVSLGLTTAGWKAWPLALFAPLLIHGVGLLVLVATGLTVFRPLDTTANLVLALADVLAGLVVSTLFAMGEEVGWRGYMLPRLLRLGVLPALLLTGFLQGVWHMPLLLTTDLYHSSGNPWIVAPLFLVTLTLAGIFFGFLRLWTGSVWPAALAHGAVNVAWSAVTRMSGTASPMVLEYIGGESGLIVISGLVVADTLIIGYMLRVGMMGRCAQRP